MTPSEQITDFLEARGLDPELAAKMGWDGAKDRSGQVWLRIPYIRDGKKINRKYRRIDVKEFRNDPGSEHDLWNVDVLRDESLNGHPLVITEGECDALACIQCGFLRTVSVPDGWVKTLEKDGDQPKFEVFKRNEDLIKRAGVIIAAVDDDDTGHALLRALANFFEESDVNYVRWPEGCKDANDTLLLKGQEAVVATLSGAKPVDPKGGLITGFSDLPPVPARQMWKIGDPQIDSIVAFRTREFSVLTGIPGAGKTTLMGWLCHRLIQRNSDIRIGLGMFETDPTELFEQLCRLAHHGRGRARLSEPERESFTRKLDRHYRLFHRVEEGPNGEPHGMKWLRQMIHKLAVRDGCNIIVIDPWNELEHMGLQPGETMTNYLNLALANVRQWAERYDVHICVVAHPRKMLPGEEPTGYHVADSAAFYNKPGMGWTVHIKHPKPKKDDNGNDVEEEPYVTLRAWKVRNRQATGCQPGVVKLKFDEQSMEYRPMFRAVS